MSILVSACPCDCPCVPPSVRSSYGLKSSCMGFSWKKNCNFINYQSLWNYAPFEPGEIKKQKIHMIYGGCFSYLKFYHCNFVSVISQKG